MIRFALGALCGALLFHRLAVVPAWPWVLTVLALGLVFAWRRSALPAGCALAWAWANVYVLCLGPPAADPPAGDLVIEGWVASLVETRPERARFVLLVDRLPGAPPDSGPHRVRLSWYDAPPELRPDQRWRLTVRLRPAHGHANPGGFDYEGWLYRQGIRLTGYVRPAGGALLDERAGRFPLTRLRQALSTGIGDLLGPGAAAGVVRALAVGDRSGLEPDVWAALRRTGTSHLVAISGLHVGLAAGALGGLTALLWRRNRRLCERWPARLAGTWAGWLAGTGYALLAGFALPTQRAVLMLSTGAVVLLGRREMPSGQVLALALVAVLARDPLAVGDPGFWLSFGAVAIILLVVRRGGGQQEPGRGRGLQLWLAIQFALTLGLAPALLAHGLPVALAGLGANLLAIPALSLAVVPLALLGTALWSIGLDQAAWLLRGAAQLVDWGLPLLELLGRRSDLVLQLPPPGPLVLTLAVIGTAVLLLPRGTPGRFAGLLLVLPLVHGKAPRHDLGEGDFRATMLDVGQGLAVVVETARRVLVFDTGPRYRGGSDTGSAVVAPFLLHQGWRSVDRLVLSHADNDHAGGAAGLRGRLPVQRVMVGEPGEHAAGGVSACHDGQAWDWSGVSFRLLHPAPGHRLSGNAASCVLRIANAAGTLLLTGDVERTAEARLVRLHARALAADVVVAPHHGSRTSSTPGFVAATAPTHVVYTAGFRNRYGFPAAEVAARWQAAGAAAVDTGTGGAVTFEFRRDGGLQGPAAYRDTHRRYWHYGGRD